PSAAVSLSSARMFTARGRRAEDSARYSRRFTRGSCSRKNFLHTLDHHCRCHLLHACVTKRALAQATVIAWRTREIHAHDRFWSLVRTDVNWVGRAKDTDHRFAERRGDVHRAGIVGYRDLSTSNKRRQICGRCFSGKIARSGGRGGDLPAARLVAFGARQRDGKSIAKKM